MSVKKSLKEIFKNSAPSKRLGQNFLINKGVVKKIIEAADIKKTDVVLEIGPGNGVLTREIAQKATQVLAVEKDKKMAVFLKREFARQKNIKIIEQDILKLDLNSCGLKSPYKIVANIPYYITSPIIRKFLEYKRRPCLMVLTIQKEVAQRIYFPSLKSPAKTKMNLLALSVLFFAEPKIISYVSKNSFWPAPKVDSAVLKITPKKTLPKTDINLFFKIARAGFSHPRKQILNNLLKTARTGYFSEKTFKTNKVRLKQKKSLLEKEKIKNWLLKSGVNPHQRAESIELEQWISLTSSFKL